MTDLTYVPTLRVNSPTSDYLAAPINSKPTATWWNEIQDVAARLDRRVHHAERWGLDVEAEGTDNSDALDAALEQLPEGGALVLPRGAFKIARSFAPPSNVSVDGEGKFATTFIVPEDAEFHAVVVDNVSGVTLRGFGVLHEGEGYLASEYHGFQVAGDAYDIRLEDLYAEGFGRGFDVGGERGVVPGTCRRIALSWCHAIANEYFGINASEADIVEVNYCTSHRNGYDGAKISQKTRNVTFRGGSYCHNGQNWLLPAFLEDGVTPNPKRSAGDGLDAFAGGDHFTIDGGVYEANYGNGITVKTDNLTDTDPGIVGYVRRIQIIGPRCIGNLLGSGMGIYSFMGSVHGADLPTMPSVQLAVVLGGEYSYNAIFGLYLNGHQIGVVSPIAVGNGRDGVMFDNRASYVTMMAPVVAGNGQSAVNTYDGIAVYGRHIAIRGGSVLGVTGDEVTSEASLAAMTKYHRHNVYVHPSATDVVVDLDFEAYSVSAGIVGAAARQPRGIVLPRIKAGQRISHYHAYGGVATAAAMAATTLYVAPISVTRRTTISALELDLTAVAAGNIRFGIGTLDQFGGTWNLLDLLLDTGGAAVPGAIGVASQAAAFEFLPGIFYGLLVLSDVALSWRLISGSTDLFGNNTSAGALVVRNGLSVAQAYGALPTTKSFSTSTPTCPMIHGVVT